MAQRIEHFDVLVDALTQKPGQTTALSFTGGVVTGFDIQIPDGHRGKTGLQVWYAGAVATAGVQVIPFKKDSYLRGNAHTYHLDTEDYPTGPGWVANAFNLDIHPHTFRCTVRIDEFAGLEEEPLPQLVLVPPAGGTLV